MKSKFKNIRNQIIKPDTAKTIQNYVYYTDRILGSGNYSVVY